MQLFESFAGHCSQAEAVSSFGVLLEILRPSSPFFFVSAAVWVGSQRGLKPPSACISELQDRATVRAGSSRTRALRRWGWSLCFPGRVRSLFRVLQLLSWCRYKEHSCASIKGRVRKHIYIVYEKWVPLAGFFFITPWVGNVKELLLLTLPLLQQLLLSEQAVFKLPVLHQQHEKYFWVHCLIKVTQVNLF